MSVGCYPDVDGPTEIVHGDAVDVRCGTPPDFTGGIETPGRAVVVSTVSGEVLLRQKVRGQRTDLRIWLSHPEWPEQVVIGLG